MIIPFRKKDKWGFTDENRNILIDFIFDDVRIPFKETNHGLAVVKKGERFAWIDRVGRLLTPWSFLCTEFDRNELSLVLLSGEPRENNCIFLNNRGEPAFEQHYSYAELFRGGISVVTNSDGKRGAVNTKGEIIVPLVYDSRQEVAALLDVPSLTPDYKTAVKNLSVVKFHDERGKLGLKGNDGEMILPALYKYILDVCDKDTVTIGNENGFWHTDLKGNRLYDKNYYFAQNFEEGIARVVTTFFYQNPSQYSNWGVDYHIPKDAPWGYIDKKGEEFWEDT